MMIPKLPSTADILNDPFYNQGTAFTRDARERFHLEGLLPYNVESLEEQKDRVLRHVRSFKEPLNKYLYLYSLKQRCVTLFYRLVLDHAEELMPVIYTPTVGDACLTFSFNYRMADGMYLTKHHKGHIRRLLDNWPQPDVDIIVVTDGSRILGLGDLGSNGMGIPIGKLSLYIVAGGFHPRRTLPVTLDVGTNNAAFLDDPMYLGCRYPRIPDEEYYPLVEEFMLAVKDKWRNCLVQFEDFSNNHCFKLLDMYRDRQFCFNDDIQGTGAVVAGAFINAVKLSGVPFEKQRLVFLGAGSAGIGVADMICQIMVRRGISLEAARQCFWLVDTKGMITADRGDTLTAEKQKYARKDNGGVQHQNLLDVVNFVKPTALVGLAGVNGGEFTTEILQAACTFSERPIVFALSNPTSKAECSASAAYNISKGRVIFASGSPFDPVNVDGVTYVPGQANNAFVFPGLGFGASHCRATKVSDGMILASAEALAAQVTADELAQGRIVPSMNRIRDISAHVAAAVMVEAYSENLAALPRPQEDFVSLIRDAMYYPDYSHLEAKI